MTSVVVWTTSTESARAAAFVPAPADERTCRSCGVDEKIAGVRWANEYGTWVRLGCGHVQCDDEY